LQLPWGGKINANFIFSLTFEDFNTKKIHKKVFTAHMGDKKGAVLPTQHNNTQTLLICIFARNTVFVKI
jgi:hypothetical protein